jgi:hypothetical protein
MQTHTGTIGLQAGEHVRFMVSRFCQNSPGHQSGLTGTTLFPLTVAPTLPDCAHRFHTLGCRQATPSLPLWWVCCPSCCADALRAAYGCGVTRRIDAECVLCWAVLLALKHRVLVDMRERDHLHAFIVLFIDKGNCSLLWNVLTYSCGRDGSRKQNAPPDAPTSNGAYARQKGSFHVQRCRHHR